MIILELLIGFFTLGASIAVVLLLAFIAALFLAAHAGHKIVEGE